jgi:flagellar biosynthesis anti-sigma factor FlgM
MKIDNDKKASLLENILKPAQSKTSKSSGPASNAGNDISDKVELSTRREEVSRMTEKVKAAPAINQEKVDTIREAIKAQTYDLNGKMIARSLLKSQLLDEVL